MTVARGWAAGLYCCGAAFVQANDVQVVRTFSSDCVDPEVVVEVILQVVVSEQPPSAMILKEKLPSGWLLSNATWNGAPLAPTYADGEYKWLFGVGTPVGDGLLRYETVASGGLGEPFQVSGSVLYSMITVSTTGDQIIRICGFLDTDGDGIPDWWEERYGLNPELADDAAEDWDGDGFSNLEEYLSDTDPRDPASRLSIIRCTPMAGGCEVEWQGGTMATQMLERSVDPSDPAGWTVIRVNNPPTPMTGTMVDSGAEGMTRVFYRMRASR